MKRVRTTHWLFWCGLLSASSVHAQSAPERSHNRLLADYYAKRTNYNKVRRDVLAWHKTTANGCVAFVSTALRHVGVAVPQTEKRDGYGVSRITFAFSAHLEKELRWRRVANDNHLARGDVVFTTGWPDHVFVFVDWKNKKKRVAWVIDNQGFTHTRALAPRPDSSAAGFGYALRAPAN